MRRLTFLCMVFAGVVMAQPPELGQGWLAEFNLATRQILALAQATPADKFSWRPAEGVRSVSEIYMHVAGGNLMLLRQAGATLKTDISKLTRNSEKEINTKVDVIGWLERAAADVRESYPKADLQRKLKFFNKDATAGDVYLRILVHNHEHMGQAIAYARMMSVKPPWSE